MVETEQQFSLSAIIRSLHFLTPAMKPRTLSRLSSSQLFFWRQKNNNYEVVLSAGKAYNTASYWPDHLSEFP